MTRILIHIKAIWLVGVLVCVLNTRCSGTNHEHAARPGEEIDHVIARLGQPKRVVPQHEAMIAAPPDCPKAIVVKTLEFSNGENRSLYIYVDKTDHVQCSSTVLSYIQH